METFTECVTRAMAMIKNREAQMISEGFEWPINTNACRQPIEQAIINRDSGESMMAAAIRYVESVEYRAENYNGLVQI